MQKEFFKFEGKLWYLLNKLTDLVLTTLGGFILLAMLPLIAITLYLTKNIEVD